MQKLTYILILMFLGMYDIGYAKENSYMKMKSIKHQLEKNIDSNADKNYYAISFASNGCNFEILINDVPVYTYFKAGGTSGMYPINPWISKSGEQRIKVRLYPVKGHEEKGVNSKHPLRLTVQYKKDPSLGLSDYKEVLSDFIPEIEAGIPYYEYETVFHAEVPYEIVRHTNCISLENVENLKERLVQKCIEAGEILLEHDLNKFIELYGIKFVENAISIYQSDDEMFESINEMFEAMKIFTDLASMEHYELKIYGEGKLAILEDPENREQGFKVETADYHWYQYLFWGIREGSNELVIIE